MSDSVVRFVSVVDVGIPRDPVERTIADIVRMHGTRSSYELVVRHPMQPTAELRYRMVELTSHDYDLLVRGG